MGTWPRALAVRTAGYTLTGPDRIVTSAPVLARVNLDLLVGIGVVLIVTAVAVTLTMQGWRSRIPAFDLLTYVYGVRDLLAHGDIPRHGDTGSYGSFKPPGTAWLMLPSAVLFPDVRLSEYAGAAILHFLTLLGLFLIARTYFGTLCACLSVFLYGLSIPGLWLAGSLWPNGRPDFFVWFVYMASLWVTRAKAGFLVAAAAVWAVGMYVDMALAPAVFVLPVLWLVYRRPVRLPPLLATAAALLVVWSPYLTFETPRAFADVRSMLLLENIAPADYRATWCDPSLTLNSWQDPANPSAVPTDGPELESEAITPTLLGQVLTDGRDLQSKLVSNFALASTIPGVDVVLLLLTVGGLGLLSVREGKSGAGVALWRGGWRLGVGLTVAVLTLACLAVLEYSPLLGGGADMHIGPFGVSAVRRLVKVGLTVGVVLVLSAFVVALLHLLPVRWSNRTQALARKEVQVLALCLLVPWVILLGVAEPGKPERFWWLFPLQVLFLAALFITMLPSPRGRRPIVLGGLALVAVVIVVNPFTLSRLSAWRDAGWSGQEADEVQVVAFISNQLGAERRQAAIGYRIFVYSFMSQYNITNPIYKAGADIDVLLTSMYGIANTDTCAEGFAPDDEFRIVRTVPKAPVDSPRAYFAVPLEGQFRLLQQIGSYQVWGRV
jgi:hypothetical protein